MHNDTDINRLTSHLFRERHGKMVAFLLQQYGYPALDHIEDAVQESFETALRTWKFKGIPENPPAWLLRVAKNKLINILRQSARQQAHLEHVKTAADHSVATENELEESLLKLLIYFSEIDLPERNKLIISLYYACGFGYGEIAGALLMQTEAVKKVILRSRDLVRRFAGRYDADAVRELAYNRDHLFTIIYLLFNEGYKTNRKKGSVRYDLCYEAMRIGNMLLRHDPEQAMLHALLALMCFHTSRAPARVGQDTWIPLQEQDRSLWDRELIRAGFYHLEQARAREIPMHKYYLEALIASVHCRAASHAETDWETIAYLYRNLETAEPDAVVVRINRIIAESHIRTAGSLLPELHALEPNIGAESAFPYYSALAYLYLGAGVREQARIYYLKSLDDTANQTDRNFIQQKIAEIDRQTR